MSFLILDGFDNYELGDGFASGWHGGTPFGFPAGRIDGKAIEVFPNNSIYMSIDPAIIGFAFKNVTGDPGIFGTAGEIVYLLSGMPTCGDPTNVCPGSPYIVDFKVGLGLDAANRLYLYTTSWSDTGTCPGHPTKCSKWIADDTTFYGWGETPALNYNEWNYVEINFQTLEVRLNGGTIITSSSTETAPFGDAFSASGIDDARVYFAAPNLNYSIAFDDFYAQDADGDFVGDIHVETTYPDADGHYTDWTPGPGGSGSTHFSRVDETTLDGDLSYNHDATPGDRDSYVMQALAGGTVYATQLNLAVKTSGEILGNTVNPFIRQAGTDYDGPDTFLSPFDHDGSAVYKYASFISDTDPLGSPWTVSTVNGDEYGIRITT